MRSSSDRGRSGRGHPLARAAILAAALAVAALAAGATSALAAPAQVNIVRQAGPPPGGAAKNTHYFTTIQAAVNASTNKDFVLIEPGTYKEAVKVGAAQSGVTIRGMNRNTVVLDGEHKAGNGIEVVQANNVTIQNLTVHDFDTGCENCGNEIWWNGGADSGKIGARGWFGSYLTAYDTGFNGGYGIFVGNEETGSWEHIYASGFNDSGIYIGACQECNARVTGATMENNSLGYSGSNSGGSLTIEHSIFRHNTSGIAPNSENPSDPPPPQDGECGRRNEEHPNPTPTVKWTKIKRCTVFRDNLVTENGNLTVPSNGSTEIAPWGVGVLLAGTYADLVEGNTITGNPTDGVLGFEYPNPFPINEETIFFQLAGNKIANNTFSGNGSAGGEFAGDVLLQGGVFGSGESQSTNNCASGNSFADAKFPANLEGTNTATTPGWGCQNKLTPNPENGFAAILYLIELAEFSEHGRTPTAQPAPDEQPTMPEPCAGVPKSPPCPRGNGNI
jgi:hypothetical protein